MASPAVEGWFTTGPEPALVGTRCATCGTVSFPPRQAPEGEGFCTNPQCAGHSFEEVELSRRGRVWSYTDAQYQPPPPYVPATDPFEPFALAAVELVEDPGQGMIVLGQVARGHTVADLHVGAEVELVVETLYTDDTGERTSWRWRPVPAVGR